MSQENPTPKQENLPEIPSLPNTPSEDPILKLNAQGVLDFIDSQSRRERDYFDRLLDRSVKVAAALVFLVAALFTFIGYQNWDAVRKVGEQVRSETRSQLSAAVSEELTNDKIEEQIRKVLEQKTDIEFQQTINKAIAAELDKPQRQKVIQSSLEHLTKHLQDRENVLSLGDSAISESAESGRAFRDLVKLWRNSPDDAVRNEARAEMARVRHFWGISGYLSSRYEITTLSGSPVKESSLTTCDLLALLHSADWKVRARSAMLLGRLERGVPEALIHTIVTDDYLEVVARASLSLDAIAGGTLGLSPVNTLPDPIELQEWWVKAGPTLTPQLKLSPCASR
jgi:hypothetical protein